MKQYTYVYTYEVVWVWLYPVEQVDNTFFICYNITEKGGYRNRARIETAISITVKTMVIVSKVDIVR